MRTAAAILTAATLAAHASEWTAGYWPAAEPFAGPSTNAQELYNATWRRYQWAGATNWQVTNAVKFAIGTNTTTTNREFSSHYVTNISGTNYVHTNTWTRTITNRNTQYELATITGRWGWVTAVISGATRTAFVQVDAADLEQMTDGIEGAWPHYLSTNYATDPSLSFDYWFSNAIPTNMRYDFPPRMTKADEMDHHGHGLVFLPTTTNYLPDGYTVTGCYRAAWTKRTGRRNPLLVEEWRYNPKLDTDLNWWHGLYRWDNDVDFNNVNEFTAGLNLDALSTNGPNIGATWMPNLAAGDYPQFRWTPGKTGAVAFASFDFGFIDPFFAGARGWYLDATGNVRRVLGGTDAPDPVTIASATQRAAYAWVALYAADMDGAPANTNDTVALIWDFTGTVYEGSAVWDGVLRPEQLNEHRDILTNMFLTPYAYAWTNTVSYSNTWTTNAFAGIEFIQTNAAGGYMATNEDERCGTMEADWDVDAVVSNGWWRGRPVGVAPWPTNAVGWSIPAINYQQVTNGERGPFLRMDIDIDVTLEESAETEHYCVTNVPWTAERADVCGVDAWLEAASSCMIIGPLYTGTQHRAHVYQRDDYSAVTNENPWYRRVFLTDWTADEYIVTDRIPAPTNAATFPPITAAIIADEPGVSDILQECIWEYHSTSNTGPGTQVCWYVSTTCTNQAPLTVEMEDGAECPELEPTYITIGKQWRWLNQMRIDEAYSILNSNAFRVLIEWQQ